MTVGIIGGETVKSSIARKIKSTFDPNAPKIYKEPVLEGMVLPCFFIRTLNVSQTEHLGKTFIRDYQMTVRYHPVVLDVDINAHLEDVANKLLEHLNEINVPIFLGNYNSNEEPIEELKPVKGSQMDYTINEGVLQVFITYTLRMKTQGVVGTKLNTLDIDLEVLN